jgi:hypothetical protein
VSMLSPWLGAPLLQSAQAPPRIAFSLF